MANPIILLSSLQHFSRYVSSLLAYNDLYLKVDLNLSMIPNRRNPHGNSVHESESTDVILFEALTGLNLSVFPTTYKMLNLVVDKFIDWNETKSSGDLYGKPSVLSLACADYKGIAL